MLMKKECVVRPGKAYFVIGTGWLAVCIIFGIWTLIEKEEMFTLIYKIMLLPECLILSICTLIFYFRRRIILREDEFIVRPVIGRAETWSYSQISQMNIYLNQGLSRPIALYADRKKIVKIVFAFSGYYMFEKILKEKCGPDKIMYVH